MLGKAIVVFLLGLVVHHAEGACCPNGWVVFRESCYFFTHDTTGMTFNDARHFCSDHGAHLVHVDDKLENSFLKDHFASLKDANYWMGLTDEMIENVYTWIDTDTIVQFTDWSPAQPDDVDDQDCVAFHYNFDYTWRDDNCTRGFQSVCEQELRDDNLEVVG